MNRSPRQLAEASARVAAVRLVPVLLVRGLLVVALCAVIKAGILWWQGYEMDLTGEVLSWALLAGLGLPILYFSSLKPVTQAVAREVEATANARFESIAAQVQDGILIHDLDGKILYCNAATEKIHAAPPGSLLGQNLLSIVPQDMHAMLREDLISCRKSGTGVVLGKSSVELDGLSRGGQRVSLEISTAPLQEGGEQRIVAVIRDISARKQLDAEITRLARFPFLNPNPILECTAEGAIRYMNPGAKKLLGAIQSAATVRDLIPGFGDLARRCLAQNGPITGIETTVRDRTLLWMLQPGAPADGQPNCVLVYGTDITERKQAEDALQKSQKQVWDLLDSLPVAVRVVVEGRTVFGNSAAARLHGLPSSETLMGLEAIDLVAEKDRARVKDYHRRRVAGEEVPKQFEIAIRRPDGAEVPVEITATRFFYGGQPGSLLALRDLSDQKRLKLYEQILPVCCVCGKIRDDSHAQGGEGEWGRLDHYVMRHSDTQLSHTFCPPCLDHYKKEQGLK